MNATNAKNPIMIQAHIFYSGMVQGVGFRYTVQRYAATSGDLKGWVRNLPNGKVETIIEGPRPKVEQFVADIDQHFGSYIRDKKIAYSPSQGQFKDFQIIG